MLSTGIGLWSGWFGTDSTAALMSPCRPRFARSESSIEQSAPAIGVFRSPTGSQGRHRAADGVPTTGRDGSAVSGMKLVGALVLDEEVDQDSLNGVLTGALRGRKTRVRP